MLEVNRAMFLCRSIWSKFGLAGLCLSLSLLSFLPGAHAQDIPTPTTPKPKAPEPKAPAIDQREINSRVNASIKKLDSKSLKVVFEGLSEIQELRFQFGETCVVPALKKINGLISHKQLIVARRAFLVLCTLGGRGLQQAALKIAAVSALSANGAGGAALKMTPLSIAFQSACSQFSVSASQINGLLKSKSPMVLYCLLLAVNARIKEGDFSVIKTVNAIEALAASAHPQVASMSRLVARKLKKFQAMIDQQLGG